MTAESSTTIGRTPVKPRTARRRGFPGDSSGQHRAQREDHYRFGLAWAEQERVPIEQGRCLQGLAEIAGRRGQRDDALGYLDRAIALFEQYEAKLYLDQARVKRDVLF